MTKDFVIKAVFGTGGMPSSHTATISAVALSIGIKSGFDSPLFALAFVIVFIVIRDATGVRQATGKQAIALNNVMDSLTSHQSTNMVKVKEVKGHTPLECFVGVLIGMLVSFGYFIL